MSRLQKKCFLFSIAAHGLLAVILIASAAFRGNPEKSDLQVLTLIPAQLLDRAGAGGGSPAITSMPQPQSQPPTRPQPQTSPPRTTEPREADASARRPYLKPQLTPVVATHVVERHEQQEIQLAANGDEPVSRPVKKHHEIKPSFTPADRSSPSAKSSQRRQAETPARPAETQRAEEIQKTLAGLASNVRERAGQTIAVDLPGVGGGEAFAGYESAIRNAYYPAWLAPEDLADRQASVDAKIVVARDGSILSAEIATRSGHRELDRSVDQALRRVTKLPPFPESAQETERTFLIRFNLEAKLSSG